MSLTAAAAAAARAPRPPPPPPARARAAASAASASASTPPTAAESARGIQSSHLFLGQGGDGVREVGGAQVGKRVGRAARPAASAAAAQGAAAPPAAASAAAAAAAANPANASGADHRGWWRSAKMAQRRDREGEAVPASASARAVQNGGAPGRTLVSRGGRARVRQAVCQADDGQGVGQGGGCSAVRMEGGGGRGSRAAAPATSTPTLQPRRARGTENAQ